MNFIHFLFTLTLHAAFSPLLTLVPGVSIILMLWFFHMVYVAADWMVMPLCLSSSMESIVAPTPSFPFTLAPHTSKTICECWKLRVCLKTCGAAESQLAHRHDQKCHLVNLCYSSSVVKDPLGQGGLPWVDVGWDPDVADPLVGKDTRGACPTAVDEYLVDRQEEDRSSNR